MRFDQKSIATTLGILAVALGAATSVHALPAPAPPRSASSAASPTPGPNGATLPFGSSIYFVVDQAVNSASTPSGTTIKMHLRSPLIVNGITLAPAGTPGSFTVVSTHKAQSGDVDGAVQIFVNPVGLPGRNLTLPLRAVHEYLTREMSAGQLSTRGAMDTAEDVFVPYAFLYQILRKGHQMVMPVGTILRAETAATIDASNPGNVVLATPPPFVSNYDAPHSDLTPAPFFTANPFGPAHPLHKGKPTLPPRSPSPASQSPQPSPSGAQASAAAEASTPPAPPSLGPEASGVPGPPGAPGAPGPSATGLPSPGPAAPFTPQATGL